MSAQQMVRGVLMLAAFALSGTQALAQSQDFFNDPRQDDAFHQPSIEVVYIAPKDIQQKATPANMFFASTDVCNHRWYEAENIPLMDSFKKALGTRPKENRTLVRAVRVTSPRCTACPRLWFYYMAE